MDFIDVSGHLFTLPSYSYKPIGFEYDENEYTFTVEVADNGEGALEIVSDTSGEVVFTNKYDKPGKGGNVTPKPPVTNDSILSSVAMFVVSLVGAIGGVLFAKKSLKEEA